MKVKQIGEFGLIDEIRKIAGVRGSVLKGIGDDCAVVEFDRRKYMLLTADMLIEGVDFLKHDDPYFIGSKSICASLSDIASCGGIPAHALVSLGLPADTGVDFVRRIYRGMEYWAKEYDFSIVGGDISRSDKIVINVSMTGFTEKNRLILRSAARPGDVIFVTGMLGAAAYDPRRLDIHPRIEESCYLIMNYKMGAMIDISDGLFQDLKHITDESNVGALVYQEAVPLWNMKGDFLKEVSRGEDYELLFTLPLDQARKLNATKYLSFTAIGSVTERKHGLRLIDDKCRERPVGALGFKHF